MVELIANVNNAINGFVWGVPMLVLLVGTGILMTILTKFFQLSHIGHWFKNTVGGIFHDQHVTKHTDADDQSISQFQSLCTALAATMVPVISSVWQVPWSPAVPVPSSGCGLLLSLA